MICNPSGASSHHLNRQTLFDEYDFVQTYAKIEEAAFLAVFGNHRGSAPAKIENK
jgi:hypothetical protein